MVNKWPDVSDRYWGSRCNRCNAPVFLYHEGKRSESTDAGVLTPICPTCGAHCRFAPSELRGFKVTEIDLKPEIR
jgi:RNase P subunit RPR2